MSKTGYMSHKPLSEYLWGKKKKRTDKKLDWNWLLAAIYTSPLLKARLAAMLEWASWSGGRVGLDSL